MHGTAPRLTATQKAAQSVHRSSILEFSMQEASHVQRLGSSAGSMRPATSRSSGAGRSRPLSRQTSASKDTSRRGDQDRTLFHVAV